MGDDARFVGQKVRRFTRQWRFGDRNSRIEQLCEVSHGIRPHDVGASP